MQTSFSEPMPIRTQPQYLWFLTLFYSMILVLANWFDPRIISIFGLNTDAGTLIFPFTFLLSDLITEVYGYKHARRAIWSGFLFNALFIIYGQIVIHMPNPSYPTQNSMFDALLATNARIIIASGLSYLCAEPLNSFVMAKLKIKTKGSYIGIRFIVSTIFASATDSFLFGFIAFYGFMSNHNLFIFILTMWLIKVSIECLGLPISIRLVSYLKKAEHLDIYDKKTKFNVFSLEANYLASDNQFEQK